MDAETAMDTWLSPFNGRRQAVQTGTRVPISP